MNSNEAEQSIQRRRAFYRGSQIAASLTFPISIPTLTLFSYMSYESVFAQNSANLDFFGFCAVASLAAVFLATTGIHLAGKERRILKAELAQEISPKPSPAAEPVQEAITASYRLPVLSGILFYEAPPPPFENNFGTVNLPLLPELVADAPSLSPPIPMIPDFSGGLPSLQTAPEMPEISLTRIPTQTLRRGHVSRGQF